MPNELLSLDDNLRLEELHSFGILDSPAEEEYDNLTEIAARLFSVPMAMISFVDKDRQWIKSKYGINVRETHRKMSVCSYGITSPTPLVVPDATLDSRFSNTLLMQVEPNIRFYAGVPLTTYNNFRIGMFCIMDELPRTIDASDLRYLERFARQVVNLLETRRLISGVLEQVKALRDVQERVDQMAFRLQPHEASA